MAFQRLLSFVFQCFQTKVYKWANTRRWEASYGQQRETSNPAAFSYVGLSQFTDRGWQTKAQPDVDANESHCMGLSALCRVWVRYCVLSASCESPRDPSKSNMWARRSRNTSWSVEDVFRIRRIGCKPKMITLNQPPSLNRRQLQWVCPVTDFTFERQLVSNGLIAVLLITATSDPQLLHKKSPFCYGSQKIVDSGDLCIWLRFDRIWIQSSCISIRVKQKYM